MSSELNLEQVAREVSESVSDRGTVTERVRAHGREGRYLVRFGEVVAAFMQYKTIEKVAAATGISFYLLRFKFLNDPHFIEMLRKADEASFHEVMKETINERRGLVQKATRLAEDALDEMEALLNESENEHIRFKVAQDLLDRDPEGRATRVKRVNTSQPVINLDFKIVQQMANVAKESE